MESCGFTWQRISGLIVLMGALSATIWILARDEEGTARPGAALEARAQRPASRPRNGESSEVNSNHFRHAREERRIEAGLTGKCVPRDSEPSLAGMSPVADPVEAGTVTLEPRRFRDRPAGTTSATGGRFPDGPQSTDGKAVGSTEVPDGIAVSTESVGESGVHDPGAGASPLPVSKFVPHRAIEHLSGNDQNQVLGMNASFDRSVEELDEYLTSNPEDPVDAAAWLRRSSYLHDEQLRLTLGWDRFNQLSAEAARSKMESRE